MRIQYMFSGEPNKNCCFSNNIKEYIKSEFNGEYYITFIPSDFSKIDKNNEYMNRVITAYKSIDINILGYNVLNSDMNYKQMIDYIEKSNIIYLMGGNPKHQIEEIKKYNLLNLLRNYKQIIIGQSAGAINMAKVVYYIDEGKLISYSGIGLNDINIYPHLDFDNIDYIKEIFEVSKYTKVIALPNNSLVKVVDNNPIFIGDYFNFEEETFKNEKANYDEIKHLGIQKLETERLILRKPVESDFDEFFWIQINPLVGKYLGFYKLGTNYEKNKLFVKKELERLNDIDYYRWTIVKKDSNKILGTIFLNVHDEKAKVYGIDYFLRHDEWNKGYITEAAKEVMKFGFEKLSLNRLESSGAKENVGTFRVMEKIGMKREGECARSKFYYYSGIQDYVLYGISKEEYFLNKEN